MQAWKPHHLSFAPIPRVVAPVVFLIVASIGWFLYAMLERSYVVSCTRAETGDVTCQIDEKVGFDSRHERMTINAASTARVLPVMTSSDTPDTVALQLGGTDGRMYTSIGTEDHDGFTAALTEIERCRAGEPSCASSLHHTPVQKSTAWLLTVVGLFAGVACLLSKRVSIDPARLRVDTVLFGIKIVRHVDVERGAGEVFQVERDEEGNGASVLLRVDTPEEKNRRVVIASTSRDKASAIVKSLNDVLTGRTLETRDA